MPPINTDDVLRLSRGGIEERLDPGTSIIAYAQPDPALFVLVSGALEVRQNGTTIARLTEPGSVVGELGLLLGTPASADVVATEVTVVRRVDDAARLFREVPEFGQFLAVTLAKRLHRVTSFLGDLQRQFEDRPGTLGLVPTVLEDLLAGDHAEFEPGSEREPDSPY
jgi:CRP/FNR family cyclic AMP-dependent transcriptional regulator